MSARLVFFGSDEIALPVLEALRTRCGSFVEIAAVCSRPDKPSGRGQKLSPNPISDWAMNHRVPLWRPEKPTDSTPALLRETGCHIALVMAYGHILRPALLEAPRFGFFNLHASLLPKFRGATPIEGAILAGENVTGVSLQRMVFRLDAGDVVDAESFPLTTEDTTTGVRERVANAAVPLILRALPAILDGRATFTPQDETLATHTKKIRREDAATDFNAPARLIAARTRALNPWPGTTFSHDGMLLKIGLAVPVPEMPAPVGSAPGAVLGADRLGLLVAAGDGVVRLNTLQRPGGKMLPAPAFLSGHAIPAGTILG